MNKFVWVLTLILGVFLLAYHIPMYKNTKSKLSLVGAILASILVVMDALALFLS